MAKKKSPHKTKNMKTNFLKFTLLFVATAGTNEGTGTGGEAVKPEPQSEGLTAAREALAAAKKAAFAEKDEAVQLKMLLELSGLNANINAELKKIATAEKEQKEAEAKNARIALNTAQNEALTALLTAPKITTAEQKDALTIAFNDAKNAVENQLLSGLVHRAVSVKSETTGEPRVRGGKSAEIAEKLLALINGGMNTTDAKKAIVAEGYAVGTVGTQATKMIVAGEITA